MKSGVDLGDAEVSGNAKVFGNEKLIKSRI